MYKIDKQFHSLREGELQNLSPEIFFFFNLLFLIDASLFDFDFSIHSSSCLFKNIYHRSKQVGSKSELIYLYSLISSSCLFKNIYHRSKQAFLFITRRPPCGTWCHTVVLARGTSNHRRTDQPHAVLPPKFRTRRRRGTTTPLRRCLATFFARYQLKNVETFPLGFPSAF